MATDPLFNWYADSQPDPVLISTPRDEGEVEQEAVAAAELRGGGSIERTSLDNKDV